MTKSKIMKNGEDEKTQMEKLSDSEKLQKKKGEEEEEDSCFVIPYPVFLS